LRKKLVFFSKGPLPTRNLTMGCVVLCSVLVSFVASFMVLPRGEFFCQFDQGPM
jgi:hypothetical protein